MKTLRLPLVLALAFALNLSRAFAAPTISATQDDVTPAATRKAVGETITYTTTISNTAPVVVGAANDATGVQLTNPTPANTTDSGSVTISPIAFDDMYPQTVLPNMGINSATHGYSIFSNDYLGTPSVTTIASYDVSTTGTGVGGAHGTVSMVTSGAGIGQFTYQPPPGFTGTDSFTYTLTNPVGSSVGKVTINVAGPVIWFVNPAVAATGLGTMNSPYKTVQEAVNAIGNNTAQRIFAYSGAQTTGIALKANGWLCGQAANFANFDTMMAITPGSATNARPALNTTKPTLSNASGSVVTFSDANKIFGVAINGGATGPALASTGTVNTATIGSDVTITGAGGGAFSLGAGNGNVDVGAPITSSGGRAVAVTGRTGGTVAFPAAISDTGMGIALTNNTGTTLNFTGGLGLSTGANPAFAATGGGTVNVPQDVPNNKINTIATTTGTALNVANTTIGASGLTFRSISANGASNGIILNNTGSSAGLTVTGTGTTAGSGGTIQNNVQAALFTSTINLSLSNMNFTNPNSGNGTVNNIDGPTFNSAAQAGINMSNVATATFTNLNVNGGGGGGGVQVGINGQNVSNLTIANSTVSGFGDAAIEGDVKIFNLSGTCAITNSTFGFAVGDTTAGEQLIDIRNNTGALTLTVTGNTFNDTRTSLFGSTHLMLTTVSNAVATLNVYRNSFLKTKTSGVEVFARDTSTLNVNITDGGTPAAPIAGNGNTFDPQGGLSRAIGLNAEDTARLNFNVNRNVKIYGNGGPVINVFGINTAVIHGRINNNPDIQGGGVGAAGSPIFIHPEDASTGAVEIMNNVISKSGNDPAIFATPHGDAAGPSTDNGSLDITIRNNSVTTSGTGQAGNGVAAIDVRAGANNGDLTSTYLDVRNNNVTLAQPADDIAFLAREGSSGARLYFENFVAGASNQARATNTWNAGANTPASSVYSFDAAGAQPYAAIPAGHNGGHVIVPSNPSLLLFSPTASRTASATDGMKTAAPAANLPAIVQAPESQPAASVRPATTAPDLALSDADLESLVAAALERWAKTGLTDEQVTVLRALRFEVADLPALHLGEATRDRIRVNRYAGGNRWFMDPASAPDDAVDLLTAIMHEMGHALGLDDTYAAHDRGNLMYGFLHQGERRLPAEGQAMNAKASARSGPHFLSAPVSIGTLPPGKSVKIVYAVTVGPITTVNPQSVSSQGTVSGSNFASVLTSDAVAGSGATITLLAIPPAITSANATTFTVGSAGTFNVTATGAPAPSYSHTGTLPSGVSLSAAGVLSGTPAAGTGGTYPITITANNGVAPNATQSFTLTVNQPPAITSANAATFVVGTAGTFTVSTTGFPNPAVTQTGTLPSGVTFDSGTKTLSGTPATGSGGTYSITFTAANGVGSNAVQSFTLTVNQAPAITSANNATFTVGTAGTFTVTATGFPSPTFSVTGALPGGVSLAANTGVLSGTPGPDTQGVYNITMMASNGVGSAASQPFTLTVTAIPCTAATAGLISWLPGNGNANDLLGANHAVMQGGATFAAGKVGQAFNFTNAPNASAGQYANVATPVGLPVGNAARTIELWFRTATTLTASPNAALVQYGAPAIEQTFGLVTTATAPGKLYFNGGGDDLAGTTTLQPNTWYHAAVTYDGATLRLYLNGALESSKPTSALNTVLDSNGLTIGLRPATSVWNGQIDELDIYNRALSLAEIQAIYYAGAQGKCAPALSLTSAVSRKTHIGVGAKDVPMPLSGNAGVEPRNGTPAATHTVVFSFTNGVVSGSAAVSSGTGSVNGAPTFSGNTMTVNLTGVTNAQQITLTLSNVTDALGQVMPSTGVNMKFLSGDANGDSVVNSGDATVTRNRSGQTTDNANFRSDINTDGGINGGDAFLVKSASGTSVSADEE